MKRTVEILFFILFLAGLFVWIFIFQRDSARAWTALLINFTFFATLAAGLVVWPAIIIASNGKWMKGIEKIALTGLSFSIPSILILAGLWFGISNWAPWADSNEHGFWLNKTFVIIRDTASLIVFWCFGFQYLYRKNNKKQWASIFIFVYCIAFSILGFDLVMSLNQKWRSALFGGYFFMTGLYIALSAWTILSLIYERNLSKNTMHDLGKLILSFCLMTAYLMFSQLLPMWYENLPFETTFLVPRMNFKPGITISYLLIGLVYLGPFVLLIPQKSKITAWFLGLVSVIVLAGMWIERWWLIAPNFKNELSFGFPEITATIFCLGIFSLGADLLFNSKLKFIFEPGDSE